ncbi:MAG: hypothetical protein ACYDAO_09810 [Thermoplasmataceae archaeon]
MPKGITGKNKLDDLKTAFHLHTLLSLVYSAIKTEPEFYDLDIVDEPVISNGFALLRFAETKGNSVRFFICRDSRFIENLKRYNQSGFERSILVTYGHQRKYFEGINSEKWFSGREGNDAIILSETKNEERRYLSQLPFPVYYGMSTIAFFICMRAVLGFRKSYSVSTSKLLMYREFKPFSIGINSEELIKMIEQHIEYGYKSGIMIKTKGTLRINGMAFRSNSILMKYYFTYLERSKKQSLYDFDDDISEL